MQKSNNAKIDLGKKIDLAKYNIELENIFGHDLAEIMKGKTEDDKLAQAVGTYKKVDKLNRDYHQRGDDNELDYNNAYFIICRILEYYEYGRNTYDSEYRDESSLEKLKKRLTKKLLVFIEQFNTIIATPETAVIMHSELQAGEARLLNDFFHLCGISVFNYSIHQDDPFSTPFRGQYDLSYIIATVPDESHKNFGLQEEIVSRAKGLFGDLIVIRGNELNWSEADRDKDKEKRKEFLYDSIEKAMEKSRMIISRTASTLSGEQREKYEHILKEKTESLKCIAGIFVNYELLKHREIVHIFLNVKTKLLESLKKFTDAYIELSNEENEKKYGDCKYYLFALRYLERYVNQICKFLGENPIFNTQAEIIWLEERIKKRIDGDPFLARLYLLQGIFEESDNEKSPDSIEYYEKAIEKLGEGNKLACYPNYLCGRAYQRYRNDWIKARQYYYKSYETNPMEYRAVYKLGEYERRQGKDLEAAAKRFYEVISILQKRVDSNQLQPMELEYYYKAYVNLGILYESVPEEKPLLNIEGADSIQSVNTSLQEFILKAEKSNPENKCYEMIFGKIESLVDQESLNDRSALEMTINQVEEMCNLL